jgi:hypothetical protein
MIYFDQTEFSSVDSSQKGNCMSACLASLLCIELSLIPNFAMMTEDEWFGKFLLLIEENGHEYTGVFYFTDNKTWDDLLSECKGCDGMFMVAGPSPRAYVTAGHAVLYKNNELLHDPHPSRNGILNLEYAFMIERSE